MIGFPSSSYWYSSSIKNSSLQLWQNAMLGSDSTNMNRKMIRFISIEFEDLCVNSQM